MVNGAAVPTCGFRVWAGPQSRQCSHDESCSSTRVRQMKQKRIKRTAISLVSQWLVVLGLLFFIYCFGFSSFGSVPSRRSLLSSVDMFLFHSFLTYWSTMRTHMKSHEPTFLQVDALLSLSCPWLADSYMFIPFLWPVVLATRDLNVAGCPAWHWESRRSDARCQSLPGQAGSRRFPWSSNCNW